MYMKCRVVLAIVFSLINVSMSASLLADSEAVEFRSVVFEGGDGVSKFYRIPALATTADGIVVAVADRRLDSNKDLPGRIDVVCRRSEDGGRTWGEVIEIAVHDEDGGYGDPAIGVDPASGDLVCVFTHGQGLWESEEGSHAYIYVSRSADGGITWSKPEAMRPQLFSQTSGEAKIQGIGQFATSGRIATDSDGRMWVALVVRDKQKQWSELQVYGLCSADGGHTWDVVTPSVDNDADESKFVQTADGNMLMSIRNRRKGFRKFARSTDGGRTWSAPEKSTTLPDPGCNGDIIALPDGTLIHSVPDDAKLRQHVSVFASRDNGATWKKLAEVCPVHSAYSALTLVGDNKLGVLTEEASSLGGFRLWYTLLDLEKLL